MAGILIAAVGRRVMCCTLRHKSILSHTSTLDPKQTALIRSAMEAEAPVCIITLELALCLVSHCPSGYLCLIIS